MRTSGRMSRLEPLPGWARVIAAAVLVAAGLLVFAVVQDVVTEVEPVPTKLVDAGLAADGALSVTVSSCNKNPTATVTERSEEHTTALQSLMRIAYAVFCLTKTNNAHHARAQQQENTTKN